MLRIIGAVCLVFISTSIRAQVSQQSLTLSGISDCVKAAIGSGSIEQKGNALFFSCSDGTAKVLFNFLGRKIQLEPVQDLNGRFENRQFGNSACYHRIEDQAGKPADDFRCDLIMLLGDSLAE